MDEKRTRTCPYCAEPLQPAAIRCPHCRSHLSGGSRDAEAFRDKPGRQIGGVSVALADVFGISVTFVRLAFVVLTLTSFIGPVLYGALWLMLPARPKGLSPLAKLVEGEQGEPSVLERLVHWADDGIERIAAWLRGTPKAKGDPAATAPETVETTAARQPEGAP